MTLDIDDVRFAAYLKHVGHRVVGAEVDRARKCVVFTFEVGDTTKAALRSTYLVSEAFAVLDAHDGLWKMIRQLRKD